jgi:membrane dipeptidase
MSRCFLLLVVSLCAAGADRQVSDAEVAAVHRSAILIDGHNDVPGGTVKDHDIGKPHPKGFTTTADLRKGGVTAQFFSAYVSPAFVPERQAAHRALEMIDTIRHDIVERYPKDYLLAGTADDIVRAKKEGRIAALIGMEGGYGIEDSPRLLRTFYALGTRYMTLTHSKNHAWAGSSGETDNQGLSANGREIITEMNRLGMLVDISHVSDKTFWDVIETSRAPVFASHSSARAVTNIPRNMTDEMLQAVAKKGGVVMVNFVCEFVSQRSADSSNWVHPKLPEKPCAPASLDDVVAHIDHIKAVAGIDAIGLGSDFDGSDCFPKGLENPSQFPNLTRRLLERGYTAAEIHKIYGGNFLRFFRAVEAARKP